MWEKGKVRLGTALELSIKFIVCPTRKKIYWCPSEQSKLIVLIPTLLMHLRRGVKISGKEPQGDEEIMLTDRVLIRSNGRQVEAGMHMVVNMQWRRRPSWERNREREKESEKQT
jgi:hypothetical protein